MSELKHCPFCGGEAMVNTLKWIDGYTATALCKNKPNAHYLNTWDEDEAKAVERITDAWNTRAELTCKLDKNRNCSVCGAYIETITHAVYEMGDMFACSPRYCPNCGARITEVSE